jgi:hypothetical protein
MLHKYAICGVHLHRVMIATVIMDWGIEIVLGIGIVHHSVIGK